MAQSAHDAEGLPPFSKTRFGWFMAYVRWYFRRHFHALRLLGGLQPALADRPVIIYTNHPGWWDPLLFLLLAGHYYPQRMNYGPIEAGSLGRYRFLESIGFVGIEPGTWRGSKRFLAAAAASMRRSDTIFWITSQGEFVDPRRRPVRLRPGVGHAVAAAGSGLVVPLAIEYPFWSERLPEALAAFGEVIEIESGPLRRPDAWNELLEARLASTQERLAAAAIRRDPAAFHTVAVGRVGIGGIYDCIRWASAKLEGRRFDPSHAGEEQGGRP
jgi:1-acyl-sn-glycerol-3-phosphate acyltransferase